IFNNSYKNVTPSYYLLAAFGDAGVSNLTYIPNSIEIRSYPFQERHHVTQRLLWVRSLAKIYNCPMALKVVKILQEDYPEVTLCMVGPDKENLLPELKKRTAQLGINVDFKGKLEKSEWLALSVEFDVFINTTHSDNMPVSLIEAMALGLPIVSTNVGGIPYLLKHEVTALLVKDDDAQAMASAVARVLSDAHL